MGDLAWQALRDGGMYFLFAGPSLVGRLWQKQRGSGTHELQPTTPPILTPPLFPPPPPLLPNNRGHHDLRQCRQAPTHRQQALPPLPPNQLGLGQWPTIRHGPWGGGRPRRDVGDQRRQLRHVPRRRHPCRVWCCGPFGASADVPKFALAFLFFPSE